MKAITDKVRVKADAKTKQFGLTSVQGRALHYIYSVGGTTTQKSIESYLDVSHPTVVGILSRLEKNGFIEFSFDKTHSKSKIVSLTDKGRLFPDEMKSFFDDNDKKLFSGLSQKEMDELERMLKIIYKNVTK